MSWRDWRDAVLDMFDKKPPPRKTPKKHHGPFRPPHSLPDDVDKVWPSKKDRGQ